MKRILTLPLLLMTAVIFVPSAQAKTENAANLTLNNTEAQIYRQNRRNRQIRNNQGRVRVVNQTRTVRRGRQLYRETYQIRYLPNGRTQTRLISRVRINNQPRYNNNRTRVVNQTRIVRVGRQRYRETIQIRYLPNGRTQTRVINRVRIR